MLIDIFAYRDWALYLADCVKFQFKPKHTVHIHFRQDEYCPEADLTFLIGWSQIVPIDFYRHRQVLVLHPSPLPRYRGGSPIQHQIMAGEVNSAVTLFKLHVDYPGVDSGPLYGQKVFTLEGNLKDILIRIADVGYELVQEAINQYEEMKLLTFVEQNEQIATTFRRRTPEQSEITLDELRSMTAEQLHNKIRSLQDPYPNAFITLGDGSKLFITGSHV